MCLCNSALRQDFSGAQRGFRNFAKQLSYALENIRIINHFYLSFALLFSVKCRISINNRKFLIFPHSYVTTSHY